MNQLLSIHRLGLLLKLNLAHNGKSLMLSAGLITGLMLLLMVPMLVTDGFSQIAELLHLLTLLLCVMLGGSLFASTAFNQYADPGSGISAIMIPASTLEKYLVTLLLFLAFVSLFIGLFWSLHFGFVDLANQNIPDDGRKYFHLPSGPVTFFSYSYFLTFGVVFLGSVYFTKNSFVKSVAIFGMFALFASIFNFLLANHFTSSPSFLQALPFTGWKIVENKEYTIDFPNPVGNMVWGFLVALVIGFLCIAYVRLKEKEI